MEPIVWFVCVGFIGELISAGAGILGGFLQREAQEGLQEQQLQAQERALREGIRWRTEDARAAGIHPLFALGANIQAPSPMAFSDPVGPAVAAAGQDLGTAVARMMNTEEKEKRKAELELLRSQTGESDARRDLYRAEAAKLGQAGQTGLGTMPEVLSPVGVEGQHPNPPGFIDVEAAKVLSPKEGHPEVQAGTNPYFEEVWLAPGFPMMLPRMQGESPEEIISEMSFPAWMGLLLRNAETYGKGWLEDIIRFRYAGKHPRGQYERLGIGEPTKPGPPGKLYELPGALKEAIDRAVKSGGWKPGMRYKRRRFKP